MGEHELGPLLPFPGTYPGFQGSETGYLWLKPDNNGWAGPGWTGPPGKCLVRQITPQCMREHGLGPLLSFPGTYPGFQVSEDAYFMAKARP